MVEEIEELESEAKRGIFQTRNFRILHDCKIGVEVTGPAKTIAPLTERHRLAVADAGGAQGPSIKSRFASRLHKKGVRTGRNIIRPSCGRQARVRCERDRGTFSTR